MAKVAIDFYEQVCSCGGKRKARVGGLYGVEDFTILELQQSGRALYAPILCTPFLYL
jgi:hypothetical protein